MKKTTIALLMMAATAVPTIAAAGTHVYQSIHFNDQGAQFQFPSLELNNPKATLTFSDSNPFEPISLKSLVLDFERANDLKVAGFTSETPGVYYATVKGGWVFNQLLVEVRADANRPTEQAEIVIKVPEFTSNTYSESVFSGGVELYRGSGDIFDVSASRVADVATFKHLNKRVVMRLKDRPGAVDPWSQVISDGPQQGFEVEFDWQGYGKRTVYLEAPFSDHEYHNFTAVGLNTVTHEFGSESVTTLQVKYSDISGNTQMGNAVDLEQLLDSAYGTAY